MITDRQGNVLPGATREAADLYDRAIASFNIYRGDPIPLLDEAIEAAPRFAMAHLAKAHLCATALEPEAAAAGRRTVAQAKSLSLDERAASHAAALDLLLDGHWTAARLAFDRHNMSFPRDLLAIQSGHLVDVFSGNSRNLRDRIARVLPHWSPDEAGHSILLGMHAFGLEECGDYARAEDLARQAVERQPLDCWAHHCLAHVMEMQGRTAEGIDWLAANEPDWAGDDNFLAVHNWWHLALFHLEMGRVDAALALYGGPIRGARSPLAADLTDASALLWRVSLAGADVGERWRELSKAWDAHADGRLFPFNDWHAVMAHLGAGRTDAVERIVSVIRSTADDDTDVAVWARETGLPLIEGFAAFWHGDYRGAAERLYPARSIANRFGGSHAQRDIIDRTLIEAALRGGLNDLAEALAHERLALKPHSATNRAFLSRARAVRTPDGLAA